MATKKKSSAGWSHGVRRRKDGRWDVRPTWTENGKRHDTEFVADVESRGDAINAKRAFIKARKEPSRLGETVDEAMTTMLAQKRPATKMAWTSMSRRIVATFGTRRLGSIESTEIQRFLHGLPVSDTSVAVVRKVFRAMYVYAQRRGAYGGRNPVLDTHARLTDKTSEQLLAEQNNPPRRAYLGDELRRFLAELDEDIRPLQAMQFYLGCRFGEVSALEWADVNLETGVVKVRHGQYMGRLGVTKGKQMRDTALGPNALSMLREHRARMERLRWPGWDRIVFPRPPLTADRPTDYWEYQTVRRAVLKAQQAIGVTMANRTHAMRHTNITVAEVRRQLQADAEADHDSGRMHREMTGHATEAQRAQYIDKRALTPRRLASEIENAIVGTSVGNEGEPEDT